MAQSSTPSGRKGDGQRRSEPELTAREREIVRLLAEGHTNKQIAAELEVAVRTVEAHRANIRRKLNTSSLTELIRYAVKHKIITL